MHFETFLKPISISLAYFVATFNMLDEHYELMKCCKMQAVSWASFPKNLPVAAVRRSIYQPKTCGSTQYIIVARSRRHRFSWVSASPPYQCGLETACRGAVSLCLPIPSPRGT